MRDRMAWILSALAVAATVAAVGVGLNGMRTTPPEPANAPPGSAVTDDPLAPRIGDNNAPIRLHVAGAVRKPGVYALPSWARVTDAIKKAGGATPDADLEAINLADFVRDGEQLRVPFRGRRESLQIHRPTPEPPAVVPSEGGSRPGRYPFTRRGSAAPVSLSVRRPAPTQPAAPGPVNLNTATREELERLPGVGPTTADRILTYRIEQGPFLRPEDLMNVKGIGEVRFGRLRPYVQAP